MLQGFFLWCLHSLIGHPFYFLRPSFWLIRIILCYRAILRNAWDVPLISRNLTKNEKKIAVRWNCTIVYLSRVFFLFCLYQHKCISAWKKLPQGVVLCRLPQFFHLWWKCFTWLMFFFIFFYNFYCDCFKMCLSLTQGWQWRPAYKDPNRFFLASVGASLKS